MSTKRKMTDKSPGRNQTRVSQAWLSPALTEDTRDRLIKESVPLSTSSRHRQRGSSQTGQPKPRTETLSLAEFKRLKTRKTKKAQGSNFKDGSRPSAKKSVPWNPPCGHTLKTYDFQCRDCIHEAHRVDEPDWEPAHDAVDYQMWADIEATIGPLEPKTYKIL